MLGSLADVSTRSSAPPAPEVRQPPQPIVKNASRAKASDVRQAEQFLARLPPACGGTSASAGTDGTITILIRCFGSHDSLNGVVRIKDGVVTDIR
jgi:hypothetical protein